MTPNTNLTFADLVNQGLTGNQADAVRLEVLNLIADLARLLRSDNQDDKINAVKLVRSATPLGLKEAKDLIESFPTRTPSPALPHPLGKFVVLIRDTFTYEFDTLDDALSFASDRDDGETITVLRKIPTRVRRRVEVA